MFGCKVNHGLDRAPEVTDSCAQTRTTAARHRLLHVPRVNRRPATPYLQRARSALIAECHRTSATMMVLCRCAVSSNPHPAEAFQEQGTPCAAWVSIARHRRHASTLAPTPRTPHSSRSNRAAVPCVVVERCHQCSVSRQTSVQAKTCRQIAGRIAREGALGVRYPLAPRHRSQDLRRFIILRQKRRLIESVAPMPTCA